MLAWGLITFGKGYDMETGSSLKVQQQVVVGADYLLKTVQTSGQGFLLVYQVGGKCELAYHGEQGHSHATC